MMSTLDRSTLNFKEKAIKAFGFLLELGFSEVEATPTLVCYKKGDVEVDVYHGWQSYEIGAGVTAFGTRYAISEIIRASNTEIARKFHYATMTTSEGVTIALDNLSLFLKNFGSDALKGDPQFFTFLDKQRTLLAKEYALDVLAEQLRPKADEAFRRKDYSTAADLYSRISERLSSAEIIKLNLAKKRGRK